MQIIYPETVKVNKHGTNIAIQHHILPDEEMKKYHFKKNEDGVWSFVKTHTIHKTLDLCLWIRLIPETGITIIDILDDDFCQPYDYQGMLAKGTDNKYAIGAYEWVEMQMEYLQEAGILSGHNRGDYI